MKRRQPGARRRRRAPAPPAKIRKIRRGRSSGPVRTSPAALEEIEALRAELERVAGRAGPPRWNANPDDVRRSVVKLVLTLVELIRLLLERQAIRRLEAETLTPEQTEAVGLALMRLEETVRDLAAQFDLTPDDLNLDLGPVGRLL
jgi:hypothetical protein